MATEEERRRQFLNRAGASSMVVPGGGAFGSARDAALDRARTADPRFSGPANPPTIEGGTFRIEPNQPEGTAAATAPSQSASQRVLDGELIEAPRPPSRFGYIEAADGSRRLEVDGVSEQEILDRVNTFNMGEANAEFARANRIRASAIDAQPRGAGIVAPRRDPVQDVYTRAQTLMDQALSSRSGPDRSALIRSARQLTGQGDTLASLQMQQQRNRGAAEQVMARNAGDLQRTTAAGRFSLLRQLLQNEGALASAQARASASADSPSPSELMELAELGVLAYNDDGTLDLDDPLTAEAVRISRAGLGFADGGMVPRATQRFADGGFVGGDTRTPTMPELQQYQNYTRRSMEQGLTPVGFEQFLSFRGGASARTQPINMADGGMVPDASGKMVVDPDPNAPVDSIPAMIDGQQPARLDSGEFVIPSDVVMFYGTDKLKKMIETARKPADGGQTSAPGVSAVSAAAG